MSPQVRQLLLSDCADLGFDAGRSDADGLLGIAIILVQLG